MKILIVVFFQTVLPATVATMRYASGRATITDVKGSSISCSGRAVKGPVELFVKMGIIIPVINAVLSCMAVKILQKPLCCRCFFSAETV